MRVLIAGFLEAHQCVEEIHLIKLLSQELEAYGHQVDHFELPYKDDPLFLPEQAYAAKSIGSLECDLLITVGFPAFLLEHPNKFVFLCSLTPMLREYWDATYGGMQSAQYTGIRETMLALQANELHYARKVFCGTKALRCDLQTENIRTELFTLPLDEARAMGQNVEGDYVIAEALSEYGEDINSLCEIAAHSDGSFRVRLYMGDHKERIQFFRKKIKEEQLHLELCEGIIPNEKAAAGMHGRFCVGNSGDCDEGFRLCRRTHLQWKKWIPCA